MRIVRLLICLLVCAFGLEVQAAKRPVSEVERLQHEIGRNPGNMELRCALVEAQLAEGDTTAAEESWSYAIKMEETACLCIQKAHICAANQDIFCSARYCAKAVKAGLLPDEDSTIYVADSVSDGAVSMFVQQMAAEDKQNSVLWRGLAQLACHRKDSVAALHYYENAFRLGDSTVLEKMELLRAAARTDSVSDSVIARIPFTRVGKDMELRGKLNGLAIRITVDTTATRSSISGVETVFMLKNDYIFKDDIHENTSVIIRNLELGGGVSLSDIAFKYDSNQDPPLILCLRDLERLGRVRINERERMIEIIQ